MTVRQMGYCGTLLRGQSQVLSSSRNSTTGRGRRYVGVSGKGDSKTDLQSGSALAEALRASQGGGGYAPGSLLAEKTS